MDIFDFSDFFRSLVEFDTGIVIDAEFTDVTDEAVKENGNCLVIEQSEGTSVEEVEEASVEEFKEEVKQGRSRKRKEKVRRPVEWLSLLFTMLCVIGVCSCLVFVTVHTKVDIVKNEKGAITVDIDYDADRTAEIPGKDLLPMAEQVLDVLKRKIGK